VGLVFQDPEAQIFAPTVWEEVAFGPANQGLNAERVAERVEKALAATDLLELRDKATQFLSYGEKKRLCLAGVLAMAPEVLLLDEPTAGLDPEQARRVMAILDEQHRAGRTLVLATHDVDLAYAWADKVFVLSRGSLARSGEAGEIFRDEALLRATSLCPPLVFTLYEALRGKGFVPADAPVPRSPEELLGLLPGDSSKFEVK
jgi:cobalt/nickel transport system ATP-binding protein